MTERTLADALAHAQMLRQFFEQSPHRGGVSEREIVLLANEVERLREETPQTIARYQKCAQRIWAMFPADPLPDDDQAHFWIERLEAILDRNLLSTRAEIDELKNAPIYLRGSYGE